MARTDSLNNFCKDIADSIREQKCTTDKILASNFDNEIRNLNVEFLEDVMRMYDLNLKYSVNPLRKYNEKDYVEKEINETQKLITMILGSDNNG